MDETTDPTEIIAQLTEARSRELVVYIDNDDVSAYDENTDEYVLSVHPHSLMLALLQHFGLKAEPV